MTPLVPPQFDDRDLPYPPVRDLQPTAWAALITATTQFATMFTIGRSLCRTDRTDSDVMLALQLMAERETTIDTSMADLARSAPTQARNEEDPVEGDTGEINFGADHIALLDALAARSGLSVVRDPDDEPEAAPSPESADARLERDALRWRLNAMALWIRSTGITVEQLIELKSLQIRFGDLVIVPRNPEALEESELTVMWARFLDTLIACLTYDAPNGAARDPRTQHVRLNRAIALNSDARFPVFFDNRIVWLLNLFTLLAYGLPLPEAV